MQIIEKKLEELKEYENNPRNNDGAVDAVAESIKEFGFKVPIVIDKDGVIIAGHTRRKAAEKLGLETVPCIVADDLTEEEIKAYRLVDNKTAEVATWRYDKLEEEHNKIENIDLSKFGFDDDSHSDCEDYFVDVEPKEKEEKKVICPHCGEETKI